MKIAHLKISNILGIEQLEFDAGQFNEVSGPNGVGKTSVLEAIKAALGEGHDATLLRKGAEQGEVVIVLDDGTAIRKRVKAATSDSAVRQDGKLMSAPGRIIKSLVDRLSVNPVDFLRATKADRSRVLMESMPIKVSRDRIHKITGLDVIDAEERHGLTVLDMVRKEIYDARTGTNRAVNDKTVTIEQMQAAMPEAPGGVEGDEDALRAKLQADVDAAAAEKVRVNSKLSGLREAMHSECDGIRAKMEAEADALQAQIVAVREAAAQAMDAERAKFVEQDQKAAAYWNNYAAKAADRQRPLLDAIAAIAANRDAAVKRRVAQETIATMTAELETLVSVQAKQNKTLSDLDAYKLELMASLPIPGVEVVDGEIRRDGVPFDRLNTAQQVGIAVEIAKLRAGKLGVVCVDGIELLNSQAYEAFREQAIHSGLQLFVSRVTDESAMSVSAIE